LRICAKAQGKSTARGDRLGTADGSSHSSTIPISSKKDAHRPAGPLRHLFPAWNGTLLFPSTGRAARRLRLGDCAASYYLASDAFPGASPPRHRRGRYLALRRLSVHHFGKRRCVPKTEVLPQALLLNVRSTPARKGCFTDGLFVTLTTTTTALTRSVPQVYHQAKRQQKTLPQWSIDRCPKSKRSKMGPAL
jgi:hypothetical protein